MISIKKQYRILLCDRIEIKEFIENWHYSKSINGVNCKYCFKLIDNNSNIIGAMIYGDIAMAGVWKKYVENKNDLIELRRLCCINDTPKNTESYFIGQTIKWLINNTDILKIISYADTYHNHTGVIYKASNFELVGQTSKAKFIEFNGKTYHEKTIRTYYTNKFGDKLLKPYAHNLKVALDNGIAKYIDGKYKNIYIYDLAKRRKNNNSNFNILTDI